MRIIAFTNKNGGISVNYSTEDSNLDEVIDTSIPKGSKYVVLSENSLPDDYFFSAWKFSDDDSIVIDLAKAKEIQRDRWRTARTPLLAALDIAFMRAVEIADTVHQASIAAQKQALRDVTGNELPEDLAAIKTAWPEILN